MLGNLRRGDSDGEEETGHSSCLVSLYGLLALWFQNKEQATGVGSPEQCGSFCKLAGHQVHAALLGRQVNGADALPRDCVGVGAVLQQRGPDVHLVLLGGDVERRVAILRQHHGNILVSFAGGQVKGGVA
ncbi:hypothetical protein EYF80_019183 [Liparis tanakae]|uniref:Uncharacterized protein n=1 Tax=Liparis tanakae TaxID=230148 RepID=A0A4Z2HXN0_9TELE|nr:hypothetical protein EYF80_019183 [Liparis tanakae]